MMKLNCRIMFTLAVLLPIIVGPVNGDTTVQEGTIYGHVNDSDTGNPVSGAWVRSEGKTETTDAEGYYSIVGEFAPSTTYVLTCYASGYSDSSETVKTDRDGKAKFDFYMKSGNCKENTKFESYGEYPMIGITVGPHGCDYTKVQDAINKAQPGETVIVYRGVYYENIVVNKQIILRGGNTSDEFPVIDAKGKGSAIVLSADGIVLEGLRVTNAGPYPSAGIEVISNDNLIAGCDVWNCEHWGIYLKGVSNNTVSECICSNNGNDGIVVWKSHGNFFRNNVVSGNGDDGISVLNSDNNYIENNVVSYNADTGILLDISQNSVVKGNTLCYNNNGIGLFDSGSDKVETNHFENNEMDWVTETTEDGRKKPVDVTTLKDTIPYSPFGV